MDSLIQLYEMYKEMNNATPEEPINIDWLSDILTKENSTELEKQILYYLGVGEEMTFRNAFRFAWLLFQNPLGAGNEFDMSGTLPEKPMGNILEQLYKGTISPEQNFRVTIESYEKNLKEVLGREENFLSQFDEDLRYEFEELMGRLTIDCRAEMTQVFIDGFRLGSRIMFETLTDV